MKAIKHSLLIIGATLLLLSNDVLAQDAASTRGFGFGLSMGQLHTNLTSANNFFREDVNPFILNSENNLNYKVHIFYDFSEYESIRADFSIGEFSVATNYFNWPDLSFRNEFYNYTLSAELSLMRYLGIQPYPFNVYGKFGFGLTQNNLSALKNDTNNESEPEKTSLINMMVTLGGGLDLFLTTRLSLFAEYDHNFSNKNIIDPGFINEFIDTDFTQTSTNWSGITAGLRFKIFKQSSSSASRRPISIIDQSAETPVSILSNIDFVYTDRSSPVSYEPLSAVLDQVTRENNQRFSTYSLRPSAFTNSDLNILDETRPIEAQVEEQSIQTVSFGAYGNWQDELVAEYTIVIHSLTTEDQANDIASDIRADGIRTNVVSTTVNGRNYHRVVIGQFANRDDAMEAVEELSPAIFDSYFLMALPE